MSQFIKPGDLVFDVGANIGNKAEIYLACNARVICIEPQPACCAVLRNKFNTNERVVIEEKALSFKSGFRELAICSQANTLSTFSSEWQHDSRFSNNYTWDQHITVPVTTLDNVIAQYGLPQFCKIDVENYEYEVLKGLTQPIPFLSFEFAAETLHNTKKCIEYLVTLGYTSFNLSLEENLQLYNVTWLNSEELFDKLINLVAQNSNAWGDIYASAAGNNTSFNKLIATHKWLPGNPLHLHLGCGESYFPGYINIDFPPSEHTVQTTSYADLYADITELQFPPNSVDEIRSHHVFEHFTRQESLAMLCAWHLWLKVGGIIVIETPDFEASMQQLVSDEYSYQEKQAILRHVFGSHEARWAIHCDGWYKEKYEHVLNQLGYEILNIVQESYLMTRNVIVTARKAAHLDAAILRIRAKNILCESLISPEETNLQKIWQADFEKVFRRMIVT